MVMMGLRIIEVTEEQRVTIGFSWFSSKTIRCSFARIGSSLGIEDFRTWLR